MVSVAPASSGVNSSSTDASKPMVISCSMRCAAPSAVCRRAQCWWLHMARCDTATALGWPLEPEV